MATATAPLRPSARAIAGGAAIMALVTLLAVAVDAAVSAVSGVVVAIVVGMAVRNTVGLAPGPLAAVATASKRALQVGIVLLGSGLSVATVLETGAQSFLAIVASVVATLAIVGALARRFGIPRNLAVLIAAGTAICGATAIMALAPLLRARATEVTFAIAVITVFGTAAIVAFPLLGHALAMTEHAFGAWAGMAIHETAQVIAAAFQYGDTAGETATIVKLTRTTLLVPLAIALAVVVARDERRRESAGADATVGERRPVWRTFPWFVVGFVIAALVNTLGWLPAAATSALPSAAKVAITFAMAGVGLSTGLRDVRRIGAAPLVVGLVGACAMGVVSFVLLRLTAHGA